MTGSFDFPEDEWSQISEMAKDIVRKYVLIIIFNSLSPHSDRVSLEFIILIVHAHLFVSAPDRLLKVKPEERLTIEGVLAHPWLNCTEALDNVLPSAQMMMDKVCAKGLYIVMYGTEATIHSSVLLTCY